MATRKYSNLITQNFASPSHRTNILCELADKSEALIKTEEGKLKVNMAKVSTPAIA